MSKEELLAEVRKLELILNLGERHGDIDSDLADDVWHLIDCIKKLDEPQKPVVPQFVADWIESQDDPIYEMCVNYEMWGVNGDDGTTRFTGEIAEWFDDTLNVENYYRACIDGYEVEKEKRHFVIEPVTGQFLIRDDSQSRGVKWVDGFSTSPSYFTETEIKAIDKRFWAFAEEVTK